MIQASIEGAKGNINNFKTMIDERLTLEKPEPIKIKSKIESSSRKNGDMHPSPFKDTFRRR